MLQVLKDKARLLKRDIYALYLAHKDPRVPWYARLMAAIVVGYAFSPIDLIPDSIPVLGYLDDLVLIPLGIYLTVKMIPIEVLKECRETASLRTNKGKPKNLFAAGIIVLLWLLLFSATIYYIMPLLPQIKAWVGGSIAWAMDLIGF
ncbi:membrane protein (plasmid) [Desulfosarcina ovata subsp. sediminis]|uniref:Membrane protein n=1 Tax=Desulfosarcina ovata subsp. sediminis TaxID=885957 RepID=A0A5K8A2J4_9BACT|nr:YkvA family protein [Desulfosarcina ovata]BBO86717.1 membrane protein [Desulfosarcina ovata subsp. sediminis]